MKEGSELGFLLCSGSVFSCTPHVLSRQAKTHSLLLSQKEQINLTKFVFLLFFSSWFIKGHSVNHFNAFHCFLLHFIVLAWSQWGSIFIVHAIQFRFNCSKWLQQLRGKNWKISPWCKTGNWAKTVVPVISMPHTVIYEFTANTFNDLLGQLCILTSSLKTLDANFFWWYFSF